MAEGTRETAKLEPAFLSISTKGGSVNYLNIVGPQIRKLRYQQGCSQTQLMVKLQVKGLPISRESLAKIECRLHKVSDTELLYFADVLKVPLAQLYPAVNGNGHLRESLEKLLDRKKKPIPPSCSGS
jgi:transcriptional regulator with XRE-family HTH domain